MSFVFFNWLCAVSFIIYAVGALSTTPMKLEFQRYGLARFRVFTGITQLVGAAGLIAGPRIPIIGVLAAGGLALQMMLALVVRALIKDKPVQFLPALVFLLLNLWLVLQYLPVDY